MFGTQNKDGRSDQTSICFSDAFDCNFTTSGDRPEFLLFIYRLIVIPFHLSLVFGTVVNWTHDNSWIEGRQTENKIVNQRRYSIIKLENYWRIILYLNSMTHARIKKIIKDDNNGGLLYIADVRNFG